MAINVVCPGCHKRFKVSDKFAGKKGPCPKCKTVMKIPDKSDEVVVHAPASFGPKDSKGRAVLKPLARKETKVSPVLTAVIIVAIIVALIVAWTFRSPDGEVPMLVLILGAILAAPPLVLGGYSFLRDSELEAFHGRELMIRVLACSVAYAFTWGLIAVATQYVLQGDPLPDFHWIVTVPVMMGIGTFAAYASFDFDFTIGMFHYGLYLLATVVLRLIMGLPAI